ncbi:MAG: hypothetical protein R3B47_20290 [Bacteroidia bacterium]
MYEKLKAIALSSARGTVRPTFEDQAQNTCIFSTEFSLRLMGDVQQYFIDRKVRLLLRVYLGLSHCRGGRKPDLAARLTRPTASPLWNTT